METSAPFTWGAGGKVVPEDEVARRRRLAQVLLERGTGFEPIQHWTQGLAKVANAIAGMRQNQFADEDAAAMRKSQYEGLMAALGGVGGGAGAAPAASSPTPSAAPAEPPMAAASAMPTPPKAGLSVPPAPDPSAPPPVAVRKGEVPAVDRSFDLFTTRDGMNVPQGVGNRMAMLEGQAKAVAGAVLPKTDPMTGRAMPMLPPVPGEAPAPAAAPVAPAPQPAGMDAASRDRIAKALMSGNPVAQKLALGEVARMSKDPNERVKTQLEIEKLRADIDNSRLTGDQKDYDRAVKQGYAGTFVDFQKMINESRRSNVNIDQRGENAFEKGTAEAQAKMYSTMAEDAINAKSDLGQVQVLKQQLATLPGGFLGGAQAIASNFGVKLGENASNVEVAQAIINKLVPQQRPAGSGSMSDRDVELFKSSLPRLSNTPEGNAMIADTMAALAQYRMQQGQIATAVVSGQMNRVDGMKALQALPNPLQGFINSQKPASAKGERQPAQNVPPAPANVPPDLWKVMTPEERALWK